MNYWRWFIMIYINGYIRSGMANWIFGVKFHDLSLTTNLITTTIGSPPFAFRKSN